MTTKIFFGGRVAMAHYLNHKHPGIEAHARDLAIDLLLDIQYEITGVWDNFEPDYAPLIQALDDLHPGWAQDPTIQVINREAVIERAGA